MRWLSASPLWKQGNCYYGKTRAVRSAGYECCTDVCRSLRIQGDLRWWYNKKRNVTHVYLVTTTDRAEGIIKQLKNSDEKFTRRISGIAIIDNRLKGKEIAGVPVVAAYEDALEYAKVNIVDEVYINVSYVTGNSLRNFIMEFERMGITVFSISIFLRNLKGLTSRLPCTVHSL